MSNFLYEYLRTFVRVIFLIRIYSYICSRQNFHECHTLFERPSKRSFFWLPNMIYPKVYIEPRTCLFMKDFLSGHLLTLFSRFAKGLLFQIISKDFKTSEDFEGEQGF